MTIIEESQYVLFFHNKNEYIYLLHKQKYDLISFQLDFKLLKFILNCNFLLNLTKIQKKEM